MSSSGATWLQSPPYMLGERPTPLHGGSGRPTFRQVPFVRVSERVESGVKVRQQLRKYLKASSATQHMVAQMHLSDACITAMQPQEIAQSCFDSFFCHLRQYNESVGQRHLAASKAYLEMTKPLEHAGRSRKWARDVYNSVQRCVQDVSAAERKMDRAKQRKERAVDELLHWRRVLAANEATYHVQPTNPEVLRAYTLAQTRFANAFSDDDAATSEYEDARLSLYSAIERRDQVVDEATELSQAIEEDRLDTMLIVMNQFVETKVAILQAEIEAMARMQKMLRGMDRDSVIQQFVVDSMEPAHTHRFAKALCLLEWHRVYDAEQQAAAAAHEPTNILQLTTADDVMRVKAAGVSVTDVDVIKDFVASCFVDADALLVAPSAARTIGIPVPVGTAAAKTVSTRHRVRFTDAATALALYRRDVVRSVVLSCLNQQRTHSCELSAAGYEQLAAALHLVLDACAEREDNKTAKNVMNMIQTFYKVECIGTKAGIENGSAVTTDTNTGNDTEPKVFLHAALQSHSIWSVPQYWGNALLLSVGDELSRHPSATPWHIATAADRAQLVLGVHNVVFGQLTSFVYHLAGFGYSRRQIFEFAHAACFAYELAEDQRIALLSSVQALDLAVSDGPSDSDDGDRIGRRDPYSDDVVHFTMRTLADWTTSSFSNSSSSQKFRPYFRSRTVSTVSTTSNTGNSDNGTTGIGSSRSAAALESSSVSLASTTSNVSASGVSMSSSSAGVRDLEAMKSLTPAATPSSDESWEELFGSVGDTNGPSISTNTPEAIDSVDDIAAAATVNGDSERQRRMKKRKNSRKFNDQLRLARALPLRFRIHEDGGDGGDDDALGEHSQQSTSSSSSHTINNGSQKSMTSAAAAPTPAVQTPPVANASSTVAQASPSPPSAVAPQQQLVTTSVRRSVDDGAVVGTDTARETTTRHRSSRSNNKRIGKSRSAASIDTTSVVHFPPPFNDYARAHSSDDAVEQLPLPPPAMTQQPPLPLPPKPTSSGMDQIKAIAAQMKLRRRTAETSGALESASSSDASSSLSSSSISSSSRLSSSVSSSSVSSAQTLRRAHSSSASAFARDSSSSNNNSNSSNSDAIAVQQQRDADASRASGVAALRARFEKL